MGKFLGILRWGLFGLIVLLVMYIFYSILSTSTNGPLIRKANEVLVELNREMEKGDEASQTLTMWGSKNHPDCATFKALVPKIQGLIDEYESKSDHNPATLTQIKDDFETIKRKIEFWCD